MQNSLINLLRILSLIVLVAGAAESLISVLHAGRHNNSIVLPTLFVIWVLSPYVALFYASLISRRWPDTVCKILYTLIFLITIVSFIGYSGYLTPVGAKPAGIYLISPLLAWVVIAIGIALLLPIIRRSKRSV